MKQNTSLPRPINHEPEMMGNTETDRASTRNPEIRATMIALTFEARQKFAHIPYVKDALDEIDLLLGEEEMSVRGFCRIVHRIETRELPHIENVPIELKQDIVRFLGFCRKEISETLERFRDTNQPLIPHEFVRLNALGYEGKPWYIGGFQYLDPHGGTTGGSHVPHLVLVRTPEFIDGKDKTFGGDYFLNSRYLEQQITTERPFMMRAHSACFMGEVFDHDRCDCSIQLSNAFRQIDNNQLGSIVYLQQEARGAGLFEKLRFYGLVDGRDRRGKWIGRGKYDTKTSMTVLGHKEEMREYWMAVRAIRGIGIHPVTPMQMITNNPQKTKPYENAGYTVTQIPGAKKSVRSAEAVSECIILKIIDQGHSMPWEQLEEYLEPKLRKIQNGEIHQVDERIVFALLQLMHSLDEGNVNNCPSELREWINVLRKQLKEEVDL